MATNKRTYPNDYFAWYNDDNRVAILTEQLSTEAGDRTTEKFDSFQGGGSSGGPITSGAAKDACDSAGGNWTGYTCDMAGTAGKCSYYANTGGSTGNGAAATVDFIGHNNFRGKTSQSASKYGILFHYLADARH